MSNERTFTQVELDQIITERLTKERAKYTAEAQQREQELNRREQLLNAKLEWGKKGLPVDLLDSLDMSKDGALEAAAEVLGRLVQASRADKNGGNADTSGYRNTVSSDADSVRRAFGLK